MKFGAPSSLAFASLAANWPAVSADEPRVDPHNPKYGQYMRARPGIEIRSSCPGINTLANHAFLDRTGEKTDAVKITRACFEGFGMAPEICAIIVVKSMRRAKLDMDAVFNLHDLDRNSWGISHSRSLSRPDIAFPPGVDLLPRETTPLVNETWHIARRVLEKCQKNGYVDAHCYGKARVARVLDGDRHNPEIPYDLDAAGHGAVEAGRMMLSMVDRFYTKASDVRSRFDWIVDVFEQHRMPVKLGWKPVPFTGGIDIMLELAKLTQDADKVLRCASNGRMATKSDIIEDFTSVRISDEVEKLLLDSGFKQSTVRRIIGEMDKVNREKSREGLFEDPHHECKGDEHPGHKDHDDKHPGDKYPGDHHPDGDEKTCYGRKCGGYSRGRGDRSYGGHDEYHHGDKSEYGHGGKSEHGHGDKSEYGDGEKSEYGHGEKSEYGHSEKSEYGHGEKAEYGGGKSEHGGEKYGEKHGEKAGYGGGEGSGHGPYAQAKYAQAPCP